jgi:hypothetical protein
MASSPALLLFLLFSLLPFHPTRLYLALCAKNNASCLDPGKESGFIAFLPAFVYNLIV